MSTITAIDPGTTQSAVVHWDGQRILGHSIIPNSQLLSSARQWSRGANRVPVVIEMIASYGMPVGRDVFETCLLIGRLMEICGPTTRLIYRMDVKMHLCHNTRAKDGNIRQALIDRFGAPGLKKSPGVTYGLRADEWQAFALAVTALETQPAQ